MNEYLIANKLRIALNRGARDLPQSVSERLRAARERALSARRIERVVSAPQFAMAGKSGLPVLGDASGLGLRVLGAAALVLASAFSLYTWQQDQQIAEIEEIDSLILSDDLPIDAYLDKGFAKWLKSSGQE